MQFHRIIRKTLRRKGTGVDLAADVNAVIAGNLGERSSQLKASSRQSGSSGKSAGAHETPKGGRHE